MAERIFLKPSLSRAKLNSAQRNTQRNATQHDTAQLSSFQLRTHKGSAPALLSELTGLTLTLTLTKLDPVVPSRQPQPYPIAYYAYSVELRASPMKRLSVISTNIQPEPIAQALGKFDISPGNTPPCCVRKYSRQTYTSYKL
ncbi:hypothetical protein FPOA_01934 [Fusarium poae]|uniref:Uncharacterized protein n=1 Tax=Fusarium poae TaxID=36050 RepID=A0A1B8B5I5_FUSPO|nr:hypothetical protein FPOA_01934 [Fusarium poae]